MHTHTHTERAHALNIIHITYYMNKQLDTIEQKQQQTYCSKFLFLPNQMDTLMMTALFVVLVVRDLTACTMRM